MLGNARFATSIYSTIPSKLLYIVFLTVLLCLCSPSPDDAHAQVTLAWNASTASGIAGYKIHYGTSSGSYQSVIDTGNTTTYTFSSLQSGLTYYFVVAVYDPSGNESGYSNEVSYTVTAQACTTSISPTSQSMGSAGGTGVVNVSAASGCSWTAVSNASWIVVSSNRSGAGNGTVNYSVSANSTSSSQTGTMTIAGKTFTVTQSGSSSSSGSSGSGTFCANENAFCSFTGNQNVRYGANGTYVFKSLTNGTMCNNSVFGDPIVGVVKQCYIRSGSGSSSGSGSGTGAASGSGSGVSTSTPSAGGGSCSPAEYLPSADITTGNWARYNCSTDYGCIAYLHSNNQENTILYQYDYAGAADVVRATLPGNCNLDHVTVYIHAGCNTYPISLGISISKDGSNWVGPNTIPVTSDTSFNTSFSSLGWTNPGYIYIKFNTAGSTYNLMDIFQLSIMVNP